MTGRVVTDPLAWRPPHAYRPGMTPRHPEDLFDHLKAVDGPPGETVAWRAGLALLADGYGWEAHEVLEPLWMALPPAGAEAAVVRGAIQLANADLKARMGRGRAARRLLALSDGLLAEGARRGASLAVPGRLRVDVHNNATYAQ